MVKIKVSYRDAEDLQLVLRLLGPYVTSCRVPKAQQGEYKKAYLTVEYYRISGKYPDISDTIKKRGKNRA